MLIFLKNLFFSQSLKCQGVLEAIQQLGAKSSLLDSAQLDIVESRLATILSKMDNVAQKKLEVSQDSEKEQKVSLLIIQSILRFRSYRFSTKNVTIEF